MWVFWVLQCCYNLKLRKTNKLSITIIWTCQILCSYFHIRSLPRGAGEKVWCNKWHSKVKSSDHQTQDTNCGHHWRIQQPQQPKTHVIKTKVSYHSLCADTKTVTHIFTDTRSQRTWNIMTRYKTRLDIHSNQPIPLPTPPPHLFLPSQVQPQQILLI